MRICVTSRGNNLDAPVDPRFGRCDFFIIADSSTMEFEVLENNAAASGGGAGIQAGQLMSDRGVEAVLTGNVGPNAFQTLSAAGIKIVTGVSGTVREALASFAAGKLTSADAPSVDSHFGIEGDA